MINHIKYELQNIVSGKSQVSNNSVIQTIANHLRSSEDTSTISKTTNEFKRKETEGLIDFINQNNFWIEVDLDNYVSEGAEQKVYLKDNTTVLKLNDSIYYNSWRDYFINLLLHNYFFPDTAYNFLGFSMVDEILYAVIEQPFVAITELTKLEDVKIFLLANGFKNTRNNDYYHSELGIILEDLHDENVLTKDGMLYFIDTVFYINQDLYK